MTSNKENHENPGLFVRIFDEDDFEVLWLDGHAIIEMAGNEESLGGEPISEYLERKHVDSFAREMYSPRGEFEGVAVLRRLTLHEAVHYLGRQAKICAFLRPKIQAERFIQGLEKEGRYTENRVADEMRFYLQRFDEEPEVRMTQTSLYRMMESQLLNITTK